MESLTKEFNKKGFIVLKNIFSEEVISKVFTQIENVFDSGMHANGLDYEQFSSLDEKYLFLKSKYPKLKSHAYDLIKHLSVVTELTSNKPLNDTIQGLLGYTYFVDLPQIRFDDPTNERALPLHQEIYMQMSDDVVTVWSPLVDVNDNTGTLKVVPGSHKHGVVQHKYYEQMNNAHGIASELNSDDEIETISVEKGDVVIFHPLLFHGTLPNRGDSIRYTFVARYNPNRNIPYLHKLEDDFRTIRTE